MYGNTARNIASIPDYATAHNFFTKSPARRGKKWSSHQRPLHTPSAHHYRIEQGANADYYDLMLYETAVARYYVPDEQGRQRKCYRGFNSMTTRQFLHHTAHVRQVNVYTAVNGDLVNAFLGIEAHCYIDGVGFSADWWFDKDSRLITDMSQGPTAYTPKMRDDTKQERKRVIELFEPFMTMAAMRLPQYIDEAVVRSRDAQPFQSIGWGSWHVRAMLKALENQQAPSEEAVEFFFDKVGGRAVVTLAAKRIERMPTACLHWSDKPLRSYIESGHDPKITEKDLIKSMTNAIQSSLALNVKHASEYYPERFPKVGEVRLSTAQID